MAGRRSSMGARVSVVMSGLSEGRNGCNNILGRDGDQALPLGYSHSHSRSGMVVMGPLNRYETG